MTAKVVAPAPALWRRVFRFIQAAEMSAGEYQNLRVDALERRVIALEKASRGRASAPREASATPAREPR